MVESRRLVTLIQKIGCDSLTSISAFSKVPRMTSWKAVLNGIAAGAALTSSVLWFTAAKARVSVWGDVPKPDAALIEDDLDYFATVAGQVKWNRWAALVAVFAALCQALALALPT
jgi:hypothetical protein